MWKSQGHLAPVNNRQSSCSCSCKPTTTTVWRSTPRITMWLPPIQRYSRHDIHSTATPRKMPWTKATFVYGFYRPDKGFWHGRPPGPCGVYYQGMAVMTSISEYWGFYMMAWQVTVLSNGGSKSEPFIVETGVKQGCVIATHTVCHFHCSHTPPHWWRAATGDSNHVQNWWQTLQP